MLLGLNEDYEFWSMIDFFGSIFIGFYICNFGWILDFILYYNLVFNFYKKGKRGNFFILFI